MFPQMEPVHRECDQMVVGVVFHPENPSNERRAAIVGPFSSYEQLDEWRVSMQESGRDYTLMRCVQPAALEVLRRRSS